MKAVVYRQYGGPEVLELAELEVPTPGPDEVLIRVGASGVNPSDAVQRAGQFKAFMGREFPKRVGMDVSGQVVTVGSAVTDFQKGDAVFGMTTDFRRVGTAAEYVTMQAAVLARKPDVLSDVDAAAIPLAGQTALQALVTHGRLQSGEKVIVNGASGGVGLFAVQIAKLLGAHVTAVCSQRSADLVRAQGADAVIDYATTPWRAVTERFDVFIDAHGVTFNAVRHLLGKEGRYVTIAPVPAMIVASVLSQRLGRKRISAFFVRPNRADMQRLADWAESGALRPHVDCVYPLDQAAEAHRQIETKHTRGKLVIGVAG